jgi:Peptidase S46
VRSAPVGALLIAPPRHFSVAWIDACADNPDANRLRSTRWSESLVRGFEMTFLLIRISRFAYITAIFITVGAHASEGLWPLNRLPLDQIRKETGVALQPDFITRALRATLRTPGWCTSFFVSKSGLALTNHHCLAACLSEHGSALKQNGYYAASLDKELPCAGLELDQLVEITDVTKQIMDGISAVPTDQHASTKDRSISHIETDCSTGTAARCEVMSSSDTNTFDLYKYRIFRDVRLVFAPEDASAQGSPHFLRGAWQ